MGKFTDIILAQRGQPAEKATPPAPEESGETCVCPKCGHRGGMEEFQMAPPEGAMPEDE